MSIVFAAITPHPLILLPDIGKEHLDKLSLTQNAFQKMAELLEISQPDTILIISPHGLVQNSAFSLNLCPEFRADFKEFGDFATRFSWPGNIGLAHQIKEYMETKIPLQLFSEPNLDYGSSVPLLMLTKNLSNISIIPLYYSGLDNQTHYNFGQLLKQKLLSCRQNIAIIASGDLSHRLSKEAPGGYSPQGKKFDKKIIDYLLKNKNDGIVNFDPKLITAAGECGLKSILILLGILDKINYQPRLLSYEAPFGVGYLVMNFEF